ncbi:MAG: alanine--glyoxylate aminotransferase family protein [Thermofilaceae archaeon]
MGWEDILFIPGPVNVAYDILLESAKPVINHRSESFHKLYEELVSNLRTLLGTSNTIILFTASGTGAVEALAANFGPSRKALVPATGEFSSRFAEALKMYGSEVSIVAAESGSAPSLDTVLQQMDYFKPDLIAMVYNDTSPGVRLSYISELCREAKSKGILTLVDAVSAVGGDELKIEEWGIDALAGASQKCLSAPPGISFIVLSNDAISSLRSAKTSYFDINRYLEYSKRSETPFTPAVTLLSSLNSALVKIINFGINKWVRLHVERSPSLYKAFEMLGFKPFVKEPYRSRTVLSFKIPTNVNPQTFRKKLAEVYNIQIAGGLGRLKDSIIRIGVMGWMPLRELMALICAMGLEAKALGLPADIEGALYELKNLEKVYGDKY